MSINVIELLKNDETFRKMVLEKIEAYEGQAKDIVGNSYTIGDKVVATSSYGRSKSLNTYVVVGFSKSCGKVQVSSERYLKDFMISQKYLSTNGKLSSNVVKIIKE